LKNNCKKLNQKAYPNQLMKPK